MAEAEPTNILNPLDFPRYVRALRPSLPESLPSFVDDELDKVSRSLMELEEATNDHANAKVEEERIARVTEDEALAARIVTVETDFHTAISDANARVTTEEIARTTADEALASRVSTVEADYKTADAATNARVTTEELTRATADEALASRITTIEAKRDDDTVSTNARIMSEAYTRATEDEALATQITTVQASFNSQLATTNAAITNEQTARANGDSALATQITNLTATVNTNLTNTNASITSEQTARADGDSALASSISTLSTTVTSNNVTLGTAITNEQTARVNGDSANASSIATLSATVTSNHSAVNASISSEQTARINGDNALSSSITTLTTTVNGNSASITTAQSSINGLQAKYGVTLDVNGYITGFSQNNGGTSGSFTVVADTFSIAKPGYPTIVPFQVDGGGVKINGNLVVSGSITASQLGTGAVETTKIAAGAITAPEVIQSTDTYIAGASGAPGSWYYVCETDWMTIGDGTDGGAAIMAISEMDGGSQKDTVGSMQLEIDTGSGYSAVALTRGGVRTSDGNSFSRIPMIASYLVESASTVRARMAVQSIVAPGASQSFPFYCRSPTLWVLGAKR